VQYAYNVLVGARVGWIEGRGFPIFIEGEHEMEIPGGRVGGEFSIGRLPDEKEELGEGGTTRFEKGVGYARRPSAFVGREELDVVNDFGEGGRFSLSQVSVECRGGGE